MSIMKVVKVESEPTTPNDHTTPILRLDGEEVWTTIEDEIEESKKVLIMKMPNGC